MQSLSSRQSAAISDDRVRHLLAGPHIIGWRRNGAPIWSIGGASPDGDPDDPKDGDPKDGDPKDGDPDDPKDGDDDKDDPDKDKPVTRAEYDALTRRLSAADQRATQAEKDRDAKATELQKLTDKDKSELEIAKRDLQAATEKVESLTAQNASLAFGNTFLTQTKHKWHDPSLILDMLQKRDDVKLKDDGTVEGMDKALDAIAKEKSFLLKKAKDDSDDDLPDGPSGGSSGSGNKKKKGERATREELAGSFPALRRGR